MIKGYIYAILSAILFGTAGIIIRFSFNEESDSVSLLTFQYIIAVIIMLMIILLANRKLLRISKTDLLHTAVLGIVGNTSMTVFYYLAFKYLDVAMVAILLYTYPIMVFLYYFLFKKAEIGKGNIKALILAFAGCFFSLGLINGIYNISMLGIGFGLMSAIFYAFMSIYSEKKLSNLNSLSINFYSTAFSLVSLIIIKPPLFIFSSGINNKLLLFTTILAVICEIIPLTLLYAAIKYIGALKVSIIGNLEIPTAMICSYLFLGEKTSFLQIIGAGMVIYAAYSIRQSPNHKISSIEN